MTARVRVPASSSNLGSGFDCIGVALDRWLEASVTVAAAGDAVVINRGGRLATLTLAAQDDLLTQGFRAACAAAGRAPVGAITIDATSEIPVGCGLGSSGAALVAGALLADAALGLGLSRERIVAICAEREGHPDNVAPAVYGGAVLTVRAPGPGGRLVSSALRVAPGIEIVLAVPPFASDTKAARAALPVALPHGEAVLAASRAAALVQGLATGDGALLSAALEDVLHVPFRRGRVPGYDAVVAAARAAGAHGATLSGAGSAMLAIAPRERAEAVGAALLAAWRGAGIEAELVRCPRPARGSGAEVSAAPPATHTALHTVSQ